MMLLHTKDVKSTSSLNTVTINLIIVLSFQHIQKKKERKVSYHINFMTLFSTLNLALNLRINYFTLFSTSILLLYLAHKFYLFNLALYLRIIF